MEDSRKIIKVGKLNNTACQKYENERVEKFRKKINYRCRRRMKEFQENSRSETILKGKRRKVEQ